MPVMRAVNKPANGQGNPFTRALFVQKYRKPGGLGAGFCCPVEIAMTTGLYRLYALLQGCIPGKVHSGVR